MRLSIRNLSVPLDRFALEVDADFSHARTAIFGPSGGGKTSLLETIAGLRKPRTAEITFDGQSFENTARRFSRPIRLRRIGYVPQDNSLFPHLSVRRNLLFGSNGPSTNPLLSFEHVTDFLGIDPLLGRDVRTLSRGENQRVVIARALLSGPRLLLLDEPLTGLDAKLKTTILEQLRSLHREFAIPMLYVTHDPAEAIEVCDEVVLIEAGKITARGEPRALLS